MLLFSIATMAQTSMPSEQSSTWKQVLQDKHGTIQCYWYDTEPFIYEGIDGIKGIEYELINSFVSYLEDKYGVVITVNWTKVDAFNQVYDIVRKLNSPAFGVTAISITDQRKKTVEFTPSYLPDISVIVTSREIPHANSLKEFNVMFNDLSAFTIHESTLEKMLIALRDKNELNFSINYINRMGEIIDRIIETENTFAYVDLPSYLIALENNKAIRRQYFHAQKLEGFAFIYPKNTDWDEPVIDYFTSDQFKFNKANILNEHLGVEVVSLINELAKSKRIGSSEENMILSKEKDLQNQEMLEIMIKSEERKNTRNLFIAGFMLLLLGALLLYIRIKIKVKANERLIELNQEKSNLMRVVSHDVRNPVGHMVGLANIIKMEGDYLNKEHAELLDKIIEGGDSINKMVKKILDVEALESNKVNLVLERLHLHDLLRKVVDSFKNRAKKKGITIIEKVEDDLEDVIADAIYLVQITENLISNALKFSNEGSKIYVEANNIDNVVEFRVKDEGPGIAEEEKVNLFKKFKKLNAKPTGGESSTGLGLSIVKKYVEIMKGTVTCESELGHGTTFIVRLKKA